MRLTTGPETQAGDATMANSGLASAAERTMLHQQTRNQSKTRWKN